MYLHYITFIIIILLHYVVILCWMTLGDHGIFYLIVVLLSLLLCMLLFIVYSMNVITCINIERKCETLFQLDNRLSLTERGQFPMLCEVGCSSIEIHIISVKCSVFV
jgi:hypothetical protein